MVDCRHHVHVAPLVLNTASESRDVGGIEFISLLKLVKGF